MGKKRMKLPKKIQMKINVLKRMLIRSKK